MPSPNRSVGLQTIFSFFLGLMVAAFVGVGVYTFHPPDTTGERELQAIDREERILGAYRAPTEMTEEERSRIDSLVTARDAALEAQRQARDAWGRSTSVVLVAFATLVMAVSLVRADQLPVISNGLLLGGVFTMVYGVGWIIVTDTSFARFGVLSAALAITLALGWVRFARPRAGPEERSAGIGPPGGETPADAGGSGRASDRGTPGGEADVEWERRLRALEARMDEAARALRSDRG